MREYSKSAILVQDSLSFLNFFQNLIFSVALSGVMLMISADIVAGTFLIPRVLLTRLQERTRSETW
jgi:ABC-type transport system involved in Fe-S cluster assembly fused permease/ATPase subunit